MVEDQIRFVIGPSPDEHIIKGRPFEVGLIVRIKAYNKERPHE